MKSIIWIALCLAFWLCGIASSQEPRQKPRELDAVGQYAEDWTTDVTRNKAGEVQLDLTIKSTPRK